MGVLNMMIMYRIGAGWWEGGRKKRDQPGCHREQEEAATHVEANLSSEKDGKEGWDKRKVPAMDQLL